MTRKEILKSLSIKKQFNSVLRYFIMLGLSLIALVCGWFFQEKLFGLFITGCVLSTLFLIFVFYSLFPIIIALSLSKTYKIFEGRVVESHENKALRSVYLTIEYERPIVTRIDTFSCFYPLDGKVLLNKKLRIAVSPKSKKAIVLP